MKFRKPAIAAWSLMLVFGLCALGACSPATPSTSSTATDPASSQPADGVEASTTEADATETMAFTWSPESDCAMCHQADTDSFDDASCPASQHADMKDQCMSCHDDPNMERAHSKVEIGDTKKKATLKRTAVTRESCTTSCHDQAELTEKGAAATVLTDKNGLTVNPHELPAHEEHEGITCASCHKLHTSDSPEEAAPAVCLNCHHANVYECNTCHAH